MRDSSRAPIPIRKAPRKIEGGGDRPARPREEKSTGIKPLDTPSPLLAFPQAHSRSTRPKKENAKNAAQRLFILR